MGWFTRAKTAVQSAAALVRAAVSIPRLDGITFTYGLPSAERVEATFEQFAGMAYVGNSVVFGVERTRIALFAEAVFKFRNKKTKRLHGSPALAVLETPWPNGATGDLLARMEQDAAFAGNAYVRRAGDRLERLRPDWVTIISEVELDALGHEIRTVLGYLYEPHGDAERQVDFYPVDEVAHWAPIPDPLANFRGMSWLTPIVREINSDLAMTEHREAYFRNHATPNLIIKYASRLSDELVKRISQQVAARHAGPENAGRTMVLDNGADPMIVGTKLDDMFSAVQAAGENRIAVAAGVPAIVAGLKEGLSAATLANYGEAMRAMADLTTRPAWRSVCAALATIVDVPADSQLWFDTSDIAALQEGEKEQAESLQIKAATASTLITAGYTPTSVVDTIESGDMTLLEHTGLYSVQLRKPDTGETGPDTAPGDPAAPSDPTADAPGGGDRPELEQEPADAVARATARHTGAMVALIPAGADAQRLEVDGGEPAAQLHTTLLYLGAGADFTAQARDAILDAVTDAVEDLPGPLTADGFAISIFNPAGDNTCIVLGVSGDGLDDVHDVVTAAVRGSETDPGGFTIPAQHEPWVPHVTLVHTDALAQALELTDRTGPLTYDRVRVSFAGVAVDVPLGGALDEGTLALLTALDELDEGGEMARAWSQERSRKHPRIPKGQPGGGRFRSLVDTVKESLAQRDAGGGDPLDGYSREQLRKAAKARGITLTRGESRESIAAKLLQNLRGEPTPDTAAADTAAAGGRPLFAPAARAGYVPPDAARYHLDLDGLDGLADRVYSGSLDGAQEADLSVGAVGIVTKLTPGDGPPVLRKVNKFWGAFDKDHLTDSEQLTARVGQALGAPVPRVYRDDRDRVYMDWADGRIAEELYGNKLMASLDGDPDTPLLQQAAASRDGKLLGLLDMLNHNTDRHVGNWMVDEDTGRLHGIDHGLGWGTDTVRAVARLRQEEQQPGFDPATRGPEDTPQYRAADDLIGPFVKHYMTFDEDTDEVRLVDNPLTPTDVAEARRRLLALGPEFEHNRRGDWLDYSLSVLDMLEPHAKGTEPLLDV